MALLNTATILESNDSRSFSVSGGKATATRTFLFIDFRTESEVILDGFGQSPFTNPDSTTITTPRILDSHPEFDQLTATAYALTRVPGGINHWQARWTYESASPRNSSQQQNTDLSLGVDAIGYNDITARTIAKPMLIYRANPLTFDQVPAINDESEAEVGDIGGKPVDAACQPITIFRRQIEFAGSETMEFQNFDAIRRFSELTGMRGSVAGFEEGSVLYLGADISRIGQQTFRVSHKYLWDQYFHCEQAPVFNAVGQCDYDDNGHADVVRWIQPFKSTSSNLPGTS
jgi:hypothetical protein